jgi:hypothetical protein
MRGRAELAAVWVLLALVTVEILVTYARLPVDQLYHVTGSGIEGGASRALLFLNFPTALVAIAVVLYLLETAQGGERAVAVLALVLCAAVFWPKIVDQAKLDARPANAVAAVGVAIAFGLTIRLVRGPWRIGQVAGDRVRIALAVLVVVLALPWITADLGFSLDGVPGLGSIYLTGGLRTQPGDPVFHPAVHHGHHHGMDGTLLVLVALILSRLLGAVRRRVLRGVFGAYLALMFCYGVGNIANDAWLEQVVKRGWTLWEVPDVTTPKASTAWALIVIAAATLWGLLVLPGLRRDRPPARTASGAG